ncbi:hypothetical protein J6590_103752, partial [Homalodisca vitripennis]
MRGQLACSKGGKRPSHLFNMWDKGKKEKLLVVSDSQEINILPMLERKLGPNYEVGVVSANSSRTFNFIT